MHEQLDVLVGVDWVIRVDPPKRSRPSGCMSPANITSEGHHNIQDSNTWIHQNYMIFIMDSYISITIQITVEFYPRLI